MCEFNKAEPGRITHKPESLSAAISLAWMQTLHVKKSRDLSTKKKKVYLKIGQHAVCNS